MGVANSTISAESTLSSKAGQSSLSPNLVYVPDRILKSTSLMSSHSIERNLNLFIKNSDKVSVLDKPVDFNVPNKITAFINFDQINNRTRIIVAFMILFKI